MSDEAIPGRVLLLGEHFVGRELPLWDRSARAASEKHFGPLPIGMLCLSTELTESLIDWNERYSEIGLAERTHASVIARQLNVVEGHRLAAELQAELGERALVLYQECDEELSCPRPFRCRSRQALNPPE